MNDVTLVWLAVCSLKQAVARGRPNMKRLALVVTLLPILMVRPAHADALDFTWQSTAWVKAYESPTQFTITGPFTLSGQGTVTFAELVTGGLAGRTLTFGGTYGGALTATGDGTYNGPMTFPTSSGARNGLGVLTPTADGFTLVVNRAASGPDAGAAFAASGTPVQARITPFRTKNKAARRPYRSVRSQVTSKQIAASLFIPEPNRGDQTVEWRGLRKETESAVVIVQQANSAAR